MSISELKKTFGDFAKDTKINLSNVLTEEGAPDLTRLQIACTALSCSYAVNAHELTDAIISEFAEELDESHIEACKSAASIMAMNNVYYRFLHLSSDKEYQSLSANLRMQIIGNPGIDKVTFELCSMAISAINGCGMCMDSHAKHLVSAGVSKLGVQSAVRIASVLNAAATTISLSQTWDVNEQAASTTRHNPSYI